MRILTVTHFYEAHGGGIERVAGQLCRQFAMLGETPGWAASDEDAPPAGVEAVPLPCFNGIERASGLPLPIPAISGIRRLRRAVTEADALVIHDALYLTSILAMIVARRAKIPVLLVQHVAYIPFSNPILRLVMRMANKLVTRPMLRSADHVVFISSTTREAFAGVVTRRAPLTLFNGVDSTIFNRDTAGDASTIHRTLALPANKTLVLFVGRFVEKKGLAIIEALAGRRPDLHFVLAGHGPIDPERWNRPNVTVIRGRSGKTLAPLYRAADVLLLPSVGEGYPLVIQEAMACGLPVICGEASARADPGASPWLAGVAILLARPDETAARVAAAFDKLVPNDVARSAMADYAAEAYSWERMAGRIVSVLREDLAATVNAP